MDSKLLGIGIVIILLVSVFAMFLINRNNSTGSVIQSNQNYDDMSSHHGGGRAQTIIKSANAIEFDNAIGKIAPDFSLIDQDGKTFKLSDYRGKNVVLFFNEGAMCYPACWNQIAALSNDPRLNNDNTIAISIVIDPKQQWDRILEGQPKLQTARILFDTGIQVSANYDVLNLESSMHRGSYPGHTYFIVDKEGIISFMLDDPNMAINNNILASKLA